MSRSVLRAATSADLPMILRAERDYIATIEPDQLDRWTAALDKNLALWIEHLDRTTVLELDEQDHGSRAVRCPVGFLMWRLEPSADGGPTATLLSIQVLPAFRRRGFGLQLLALFADQAQAAGAAALRLGVHADNPARRLYERTGYQLVGRDGDYLLYELVPSA